MGFTVITAESSPEYFSGDLCPKEQEVYMCVCVCVPDSGLSRFILMDARDETSSFVLKPC